MGKTNNSGLAHGTGGSPQGTIEQGNLANKVNELNASIKYNIIYDKNKMDNYLLNINHSEGGSKAKYLHDVLGYSKEDSSLLHSNIVESLVGKKPYSIETTTFGEKLKFRTELKGKDGKYYSANVVVVIQKDNGRTHYRIITLYPGKKEGK